jgi:hypothetical protein
MTPFQHSNGLFIFGGFGTHNPNGLNEFKMRSVNSAGVLGGSRFTDWMSVNDMSMEEMTDAIWDEANICEYKSNCGYNRDFYNVVDIVIEDCNPTPSPGVDCPVLVCIKPPSYVVECDVDCTETCHEDYMKEVNERDRGLCTAKDAIRSDSCTKCDGVAVTSSSKLLMLSAAGMMWPCYS